MGAEPVSATVVQSVVGPAVTAVLTAIFRAFRRPRDRDEPAADGYQDLSDVLRRIDRADWRSKGDFRRDFQRAPVIARGKIKSIVPPDASGQARVVMSVRRTDYDLRCALDSEGYRQVALAYPGWRIELRGQITTITDGVVELDVTSIPKVERPWWRLR